MYSDHALTAFLGPCLTEQAATVVLDTPTAELARYAKAGTVIRVLTPDGTALYPEWAISGRDVKTGVLYASAFTSNLGDPTGLTFAVWMLSPTPALDGNTPLQWIDADRTDEDTRLQAWAALSRRTYRDRVPSPVHLLHDDTTVYGVYADVTDAERDAATLRKTGGNAASHCERYLVDRDVEVLTSPRYYFGSR